MRGRVVAALVCLLGAVCLTAGASAQSGARSPLAKRLARALAVPHVDRSRSGALVLDLATGTTLFARNGWRPLVPASNQKLLVAYAALVAYGPSFRIETDVLGDGRLHGSTWRGDLILKGRGDPTLARSDLRRLASRLRAMGIRRVAGRIVGDESYFDSRRTAPGWKSWFYISQSPPLSALVVNRGRFLGVVSPRPALVAALAFRRALRRAGVAVPRKVSLGRAASTALPLASVSSPPLGSILRFMGLESDNFTAELVLKQLGTLAARRGSTAAGARAVRHILAMDGIPLAGVRIADGSGLSSLNRLTVRALGALLWAAWNDPGVRPTFLSSLPVAGRSGTLEDRMRSPPARGTVFAKTGTTAYASALSGFVKRRFAFAIVQNGRPVSHWWAQRAQDRFAAVLAAQ